MTPRRRITALWEWSLLVVLLGVFGAQTLLRIAAEVASF